MNTLALLILQSTRQDQRRRTVRVVRETDTEWDGRPLDNPESVLPFAKYHWVKIDPDQKAGPV